MTDIYIDPVTHDLDFKAGAFRYTLTEDEATRQRLAITLQTFRGEWFANTNYGVPYLTNKYNKIEILGKGRKDFLDFEIKSVILADKGVVRLISYESIEDKVERKVTISFRATTTNESIIDLTVQI